MKKILLALVIVFALSMSASAQVPSSPFSFYAGGLMSLPQSPDAFKDLYKNGWHGYAGVGYKVMPMLQIVGKVEYHSFSFDFDNAGLNDVTGGTNKMLMFGADGRYSFNIPAAPIKPFALAGAGVANISASEFESTNPLVTSFSSNAYEDQTKMYWNIGAGVDFSAGPMFSFFAQARYVSVQTEGEASNFIPITLGLRFF